ncbi:unnamed protein product [Toxocara canis]|uniref:Chromo domain-containing protein n=1 Tax=Toxocara canis TaxID=6265 RepID=A0A183US91_TOXCA|nr:unnamed protein product [Toxocara canis]
MDFWLGYHLLLTARDGRYTKHNSCSDRGCGVIYGKVVEEIHPLLNPERESALEDEQSQRGRDEEFTRRQPDSSRRTHHQSDVRSNEEQDDISVSSQRPPRPGTKSVRMKRRRTERERRKEQREQMAYKNRRRPVKLTLYQFIKQEVLQIPGSSRVLRRRKPKRVEREAVFRRVRRPTPSPPDDLFCMKFKKKKKPYVQFEKPKAENLTSPEIVEFQEFIIIAIREVADDENISKEYDTLFPTNDPISKSKRESSEPHRLFKKKIIHRLKQLTHSESSSNRSGGRMNRAKPDNCKKPRSSPAKDANSSKGHLKDKSGQNENEESSLANSVKVSFYVNHRGERGSESKRRMESF